MPNETDLSSSAPSESGLSGLLGLLLAYANYQSAKMRGVQQQAFPSFGGQTQELPVTSGVVPSFPGRMLRFPLGEVERRSLQHAGLFGRWAGGSQPARASIPAGVGAKFPPLPSFDPKKLMTIQEGATPRFSADRFLPGARMEMVPKAAAEQGIPPEMIPALQEQARQFEQQLLEAVTIESRDFRHLSNLLRALSSLER